VTIAQRQAIKGGVRTAILTAAAAVVLATAACGSVSSPEPSPSSVPETTESYYFPPSSTVPDPVLPAEPSTEPVYQEPPATEVAPVRPAPAQNCDPNYEGACVPIASDVDCAGGSGNGPAYVDGPVWVVGEDIYGLDRNGDGEACES
jgi:hypothetical protein